ncbi:MAG: hypothetical protein ACYCSS_06315 [Sulfuriferula sp.]
MSSISSVASQNNPIISSNQNTQTRPISGKDGDGDHGVEPAAPSTATVNNTPAPGQPGAIINTTA